MTTEIFDCETTKIIIAIEKKYDFEENYLLPQLYKLIKYDFPCYESESERKLNYRASNIKKKYKNVQKKTEELIAALSPEPHINFSSHIYVDFMEVLHIFNSETIDLINSIKDTGGRTSGSKEQFLIFHLVRIYLAGTRKNLQCYYSDYDDEEGKARETGETHEFLIEINTLFSKINAQLEFGTPASIRNTAIKLHKKFEKFHQYIY